jgi:hypothetical protein
MRGKQFFNFPAFDAARDKLVCEGWEVISPADIDREHGFDALELSVNTNWNDLSEVDVTREECFDRDMKAIRHDCSAIYMLKGWQGSTGAQAEYWAAKWLHLDIYYEEESICEEAFRIQGGDRQQDYGDPTQNFCDIADLWNTYLRMDENAFIDIQSRDVAHMMILMKIARNCHKAKRDNWVDIAGYSQCGGKIDKV